MQRPADTAWGIKDVMKRAYFCKKNLVCPVFIFLLISFLFSGCTDPGASASEERSLFAMDTYMTLTAYGQHASKALDAAEKEIHALDQLLSTGDPNSEITKLNQEGEAALSDVSSYLLQRSFEVYDLTGGAFNPLIYPLMKAWGFTEQDYRLPDEMTISALLPLLHLDDIDFDEKTKQVAFQQPGMMLDFGGIAKGYTSARIMQIFAEQGVTSGLVSLGGNVQVLGSKPDGSLYKVAIRDPERDQSFLGIVEVADKAVITSGGYERYFEEDGVIYHHILDPETGYPADRGLISVTIVSSDGTLADGLSTALYVLGEAKGSEVWKSHSDLFDVIFLTEDHTLYVSDGLRDTFTSQGYPVRYITAD